MKGILADNNIHRHVSRLFHILQSETWQDLWKQANLPLITFRDLELAEDVPDSTLWHTCQAEGIILITANRNQAGRDSLETTIRAHNQPGNLPVFTIATANKVLHDHDYAERVAAQLLDYLLNIDLVRGTGRLYLP